LEWKTRQPAPWVQGWLGGCRTTAVGGWMAGAAAVARPGYSTPAQTSAVSGPDLDRPVARCRPKPSRYPHHLIHAVVVLSLACGEWHQEGRACHAMRPASGGGRSHKGDGLSSVDPEDGVLLTR
jgi:hypothetical protein